MRSTIRFVATGDSYITRRLPEPKPESFRELADIIQQGDVRFTNLEVTVHQFEGIPSALSGGQWAMSSPDTLTDLQAYGFNMMAWATNHTMDYLYGGLAATEKYLNERRIVHAGAGMNLACASEPRYLETPAGRVALLAATSTFHDFQRAGEQRPDMIGRPGVNPLRFETTYKVPQEKLEQLKAIADGVKINARQNMSVKNGYQPSSASNVFLFGAHTFEASNEEGVVTKPNPTDLNRMTQRISEARRQADYVLVSVHSHDLRGAVWEEPAQFVETYARACIDAGADAVIGHGPHILRGIELYRGRPIFYSLGNFIFENDSLTHLPADSYTKYDLGHTNTVADAIDAKSKNGTRGYVTIPEVWQTVIPSWTMKDGKLQELLLYPVELGFGQPRQRLGTPKKSTDDNILRCLQRLSAPYGTRIVIEDHVGKVILH